MISVVIPVYGPGPHLERVLDALNNQCEPISEIIVSHSGEGDPTFRLAGYQNVRVMHSKERLFAAEARNRALEQVQSEWVAFIDEDVIVVPDWLSEVRSCITQNKAVCILGSIDYADTGGYWGLCQWMIEFSSIHPEEQGRFVEAGGSGNMVIRREFFREIGAFPTRFIIGQDTAAHANIRDAGEKIWFQPGAVGGHINVSGLSYFLRHNYKHGVYGARIRFERPELSGSIATRYPLLSLGLWLARLGVIYKRKLVSRSRLGLSILLLPGITLGLLANNAGFAREVFTQKKYWPKDR